MTIKEFIWDLFPHFYKEFDTYKDGEGKGLLERFIKIFGEEVDDEVLNILDEDSDDYYQKNLIPLQADEKFINILAIFLGNPPSILETLEYSKLLQYIVYIYKLKGTKLAYHLFLNLLGFTVVIEEFDPEETTYENIYDNSLLYDELNYYDDESSTCATAYCSDYKLTLTPINEGTVLTEELENQIKTIVRFIEPINARLQPLEMELIEHGGNDTGTYCILQHLSMHLALDHGNDQIPEGSYDEYYLSSYDCDGTQVAHQGLLTFDNDEVTFDEGVIDWSQVYH